MLLIVCFAWKAENNFDFFMMLQYNLSYSLAKSGHFMWCFSKDILKLKLALKVNTVVQVH